MQQTADSVAIEGKLSKALMFFRVGALDTAMLMDWSDDHGWCNPKPIDHTDMVAIANQTSSQVEILPSNIITYSSEIHFSWWVPAKRRKISVKGSSRKVFTYPAMVFHVMCGTLSVGCLKKNRRPTSSTRIYNIFGSIDVHETNVGFCLTRIPTGIGIGMIPEWENAFFRSKFNHLPDLNRWEPTGDVEELCTR